MFVMRTILFRVVTLDAEVCCCRCSPFFLLESVRFSFSSLSRSLSLYLYALSLSLSQLMSHLGRPKKDLLYEDVMDDPSKRDFSEYVFFYYIFHIRYLLNTFLTLLAYSHSLSLLFACNKKTE
jgi:hypothetical protein